MNKLMLNITDFNKLHPYNVELFDEIEKKYGVKTETLFLLNDFPTEIITQKEDYFTKFDDLKNSVEQLAKNNEIIFINTFSETLIPSVIELSKLLQIPVSDNPEMFRDKSLQRELMLDFDKEITVNYKQINLQNFDIEELEKEFEYPFVVKPTSGLQSSGVMIINSRNELDLYVKTVPELFSSTEDRNLGISEFIIEEYIDGDMYSIDYFVGSNGEINISKLVKVGLGDELGVKDFMNYSRFITEKTDSEIDLNRLREFITKNIKATGLKNTFVHHEFKKTSKDKLKTIELNGRIGGFRPYLYNISYGLNLFELIFNDIEKGFKTNCTAILIYPDKKGILDSFDENLITKTRGLKSFHKDVFYDGLIGKEVGLTSDGFGKVGVIWLMNDNLTEFNSDFDFIKKNFFKYTKLKEDC